ncbi:hypothetical protein PHMEG_0008505 [Phytophthora megakarya]|uniref:Tubby C-terminal domain-containing protein n=1 Tax=Phytophthora megakarya TaxID=4795 RepID=A0A225WL04_9STRA|nr:hypothetical protein PHMEG_0008505 [Phytophthora megakarya]
MAPPPNANADAKGGASADPTKKKKAMPPPSNPPPKAGASAAAAFRSKSTLPPPNGPPPGAGAPSASVAKIRGAARPPSSGPPPSGTQVKAGPPPGGQAKAMGPPSSAPPSSSPPSMAPAKSHPPSAAPSKMAAKPPSTPRTEEDTKAESRPAPSGPPKPKPDAKRSPPTSARGLPDAKSTPRVPPVDILGDDAPVIAKTAPSAKSNAAPVNKPPKPVFQTEHPPATAPVKSPPTDKPPTVKSPLVMKSTMEVLNDTTAALSARGRASEEEYELSRTNSPPVKEKDSSVFTTKMGMAAQFSGQSRLNVPEEEIIIVKKRESKSADEVKSNGSSIVSRPIPNVDDPFDDVEEIPFLDDNKPDAEEKDKPEEKHVEHEDDPDIVMENKRGPLKQTLGHSPSSQGDIRSEHKDNEEKEDGEREQREHRDRDRDRDREKSRERRKEKRRNKQDEPKKMQAQFFNPKSVPYIPDHLLEFVKRPLECGRGQIVKCFIERNDSGPNKLAPIYTLLLEVNSSSGRPIMYARKMATSRITSHYVISMNRDDLFLSRMMRSHQYIGKLRSSTNLMEYSLYDQGDNPEDLDSDCEVDDELRQSIRAELAVIRYHYTKKPYPRKMEVVIPSISDNGQGYLEWRPLSRDQMMEEHVRNITAAGGQNVMDANNFVFLHKRETKYDPLSSCIVDFRSRATCVSVKNFQLVHSEPTNEQMRDQYRKSYPDFVYDDQGTVSLPQEYVLLQLGKVGKDCFNMDFQYPLSMLQAFAISLSRFDTKQR